MKIRYSKDFLKSFKIRILPNQALLKKFEKRLILFQKNPGSPLLRNHKLAGSKSDYRSFSITGGIRVIYVVNENTVYFLDIGTHNQVY